MKMLHFSDSISLEIKSLHKTFYCTHLSLASLPHQTFELYDRIYMLNFGHLDWFVFHILNETEGKIQKCFFIFNKGSKYINKYLQQKRVRNQLLNLKLNHILYNKIKFVHELHK